MIQDISPYRLDMAYHGTAPVPDDCFFSFRGEDVLLRDMGDRFSISKPMPLRMHLKMKELIPGPAM